MAEQAVDIVVTTLNAELRRTRGKLDGATKRMAHAHSQVAIEKGTISTTQYDILLLEAAIRRAGGVPVQPGDGEEPFVD